MDRRTSFRCRTQLEDVAILRTDKTDLVVTVVEESSGGFGVYCPQQASLKPGCEADLAMRRGACRVRVAHISRKGAGHHVGLERLSEMSGKPPGVKRNWLGFLWPSGQSTSGALAAVGFSLLVFVAGATAPYLLGWWELGPVDVQVKVVRDLPLAQDFRTLLDSGEFSEALNLEPSQQDRIGGIVDGTFARLANLYSDEAPGSQRRERGIQLIRAAWEQIIGELSDEQRELWDALLTSAARKSRRTPATPAVRVVPSI